ncbi:hypothetical protein GOP47_0021044 [Adiantum capillus-veneris]|uniref:Uncharacterized protein n=1 Tax=Adiantum capillus-veneris TaxID=13818 RepID=A0A9D4Z7I9_ADICA|nr:hypothetical protein GOP47_0021044 [Adiantum capillus-veneris]
MNKKGRWRMENTQPITPLEPCEWLNKLLMSVWPNYLEPKLSHKFAAMMMKKFKASKPNLIENAELQEFSLGLAPPAIGLECTYWTRDENEQVLHTGFHWDTNEMSIVIAVTLVGPLKKRVLIAVNNLHIKGDLRVVPILDGHCVLYSFDSAPKIRVGVAFGGDSDSCRMMEIPGISFLLERILLSTLVKNMVEPQRVCLSFPPVDLKKHVLGAVLSVTIVSGKNLCVKNCSLDHSSSITSNKEENNREADDKKRLIEVKLEKVVRRTQCCMEGDLSPNWDETFDMILDGSTGSIHFNVLGQSSKRSELQSLGQCKVKVKYVQDDSAVFWTIGRNNSSIAVNSKHLGEIAEMTVPLEGNSHAEIDIKLVVKQWNFSAEDKYDLSHGILGSLSSFKDTTGRTLKVVVEEGRNIAAQDKDGSNDPYVLLQYGKTVRKTKTIRRSINPSWNQTFEFAEISGGEYLKVKCFDADWVTDETLGTARVNLEGLEDDECRSFWVPLEGMNTGEVRVTIKAVRAQSYSKNATPANGVLELVVLEARDLVAADFSGTSDPFVSVHYGKQKKRTKVVYKKLNPQWNQTLEFLDDGKVLELHVKDHNVLLPTSNIGQCIVQYKDLLPNKTLDTWIPLRGVKTGEVHVQVTRRLHAPQKAPSTQPVNAKSLLANTSLKISSCLKEAFQLAEDGESGQLREKIVEIESLENDQEAHILQVLREKEMLLSKISELERVMESVK